MQLTTAQRETYRDQGCLVIEGLVTPDQVEALRADAVKICRGAYAAEALPPVPAEWTDEQATRQYLCLHQVHRISPVQLELGVKHAGIAAVLSQLIGPDVKCMQSMLFLKPPRFPGQAWHQDEIYIPTRDRSLTGAWIALDDAAVENGCLWILPGTQRGGYLYPQRAHDNPAEFDFAPESYGFDASSEVPVECPTGSVVFFNGYLLHRSAKNRSDRYRRVLVNHYMSAQSLLPWHPPGPGERMATADYRGVVLVAGQDPYAWKGTVDESAVHVRTFDPVALAEG